MSQKHAAAVNPDGTLETTEQELERMRLNRDELVQALIKEREANANSLDREEQLIKEVARLEADKSSFMNNCLAAIEEVKKKDKQIEQLIAENERLKTCQSCGGQGYVELSHDPYYSEPCECVMFEQVIEEYPKLKLKLAEQDKEIQRYKTSLAEIKVITNKTEAYTIGAKAHLIAHKTLEGK